MDRRDFLRASGAGVVGTMLVPVPALASHITESTRPIDPATIDFRLYRYPDLTTQVDFTLPNPTFSFDVARVEPFIGADQNWPDRDAPSEHWTAFIVVNAARTVNGRNVLRPLWEARWDHQNTPPHPKKPTMEWVQSSTYRLLDHPGRASVKVEIVGSESGLVATLERFFTIVV